jgi:hypothetical protein
LGPDGGRFQLVVDGRPIEPPFDARGTSGALVVSADAPVHLTPGEHLIDLVPRDTGRRFSIVLDQLELRPR